MKFHGYINMTYENGFAIFSWLAVWLCAAAWAGGLRLYLSYLTSRLKHSERTAPITFMHQYSWELKMMYYVLMFSLVLTGVSTYYVYMFSTPIWRAERCITQYSPTEEQIRRGTIEGSVYCLRDAHFFIMYSGFLWFPIAAAVVGWMWNETRQFTKKTSFGRLSSIIPQIPQPNPTLRDHIGDPAPSAATSARGLFSAGGKPDYGGLEGTWPWRPQDDSCNDCCQLPNMMIHNDNFQSRHSGTREADEETLVTSFKSANIAF